MCNDTIVLQTCRHTHTHRHTHTWSQTETWIMAACFSRFPFPCRAAKALEALMIPSVSISVVSTILEQRLWPFKVKGRCERCFLKHQSSDDLPEVVLTVDSHCQYTCKVCAPCQSSISCVAELLTSRHSICPSKLSKHLQPCRWFQKLQHPVCFVLHCESLSHTGNVSEWSGFSQEHLSQNHQGHCTHRARTSKILEQKWWPSNVKGEDMSDAL